MMQFKKRENLNKLVIDVGMGVFIELTYKEAKDKIFTIKMELERLLRKVDIDIIDIKTNIKMVTNSIKYLYIIYLFWRSLKML